MKIIDVLSPRIGIVCHDNGRFGRQIDPHPSRRVVKLLDDHNVTTIYTNPVVKEGRVVRGFLPETRVPKNIELVR